MKVKQGDIFQIGDHIIACGSATDKEFVAKVATHAGKIRMILTDPPYGVAYVENKRDISNGKTEFREILNDHLQTEKEYIVFTKDYLEAIKPFLESYNQLYIFNSDLMYSALKVGIELAGFYYSQMLIWVKNTIVMGRKDYLPQHELVAYGWFGRHKMERPKAKSVIFHPKPNKSTFHPTMKPIGLLRSIIPNGTKTGEWIYDPFGGSGSTLIACENMGRKCLMIELDPFYVEKIIERFQNLNDTARTSKKGKVIHRLD